MGLPKIGRIPRLGLAAWQRNYDVIAQCNPLRESNELTNVQPQPAAMNPGLQTQISRGKVVLCEVQQSLDRDEV